MRQSLKILIVEDERIVAEDLSDMLLEAGYSVAGIASNAAKAMELFNSTNPDIALMDIQLQGDLDGVDVAGQFNGTRRIPIIYLTAQGDQKSVSRAKATQPSAFLLKPFEERGLLIALDIAISNFVSQQAAPHPIAEQVATVIQVTEAKERLNAEAILSHNDTLFVKQNYKFVKFSKSELYYIEADGSYSYLHTSIGKLALRISLSQILEKLADKHFIRVHRSFVVNIKAIESFSESEIMANQKQIPLGSAYKDEFLRSFKVL